MLERDPEIAWTRVRFSPHCRFRKADFRFMSPKSDLKVENAPSDVLQSGHRAVLFSTDDMIP